MNKHDCLHDFATRLRDIRKARKISQSALARELNLERSSINAWELGFSMPAPKNLIKLADFFNISLDCLLKGNVDDRISVAGLTDEQLAVVKSVIASFRACNES